MLSCSTRLDIPLHFFLQKYSVKIDIFKSVCLKIVFSVPVFMIYGCIVLNIFQVI